ncbi:MAG TPA: dipeptide epimerase [Rhizomicrobium sp.]|nr:dipeptide epimerase [Rhizomicrobium sp.]
MLSLDIRTEHWPFREPFRISGYTFTDAKVIVVTLNRDGVAGQGEATGVYYHNETPQSLTAQIEAVRPQIEAGISRQALRELLPVGGARNAVDCALWDLEAKASGVPAWQIAGLQKPGSLRTTFTVGADTPEKMAAVARGYAPAPRLKVKLTGQDDAPRVKAIRAARPDAWIGIDGNQGFTRATLEALMPMLVEANVSLIEQPVGVGNEAELDGLNSPIPLAAEESVQGLNDVASAKGRFDVVNIKLDKCGGLTEALLMAHAIKAGGMRPMVGCMESTSLAMMPGCLAGQLCEIVDMDAALFLARDRKPSVVYHNGEVTCPDDGWGSSHNGAEFRAA